MLPTDPVSARQLRNADLLVAAEARDRHEVRPRRRFPSPTAHLHIGFDAIRRRLPRSRPPAVGPLSASHDLFRGLPQTQLAALAHHVEIRECRVGEALGRQHERATHFVIVLDAHVGVTIDGVPTAVLDHGSHFGAVPLLDRGPALHRASFDVLVPGRVALADPRQFRTILDDFPTVAIGVYAMTRVRREYLDRLADCEVSQSLGESTRAMLEYPVHLLT